MTEVDVSAYAGISNTPPDQAARNIAEAEKLDIDPDYYAENSKDLTPADPVVVDEHVRNVMGKSSQHASIVKTDVNVLNGLRNQVNFTASTIRNRHKSRELFNIYYDIALSGREMTDEEYSRSIELHHEVQNTNLRDQYGFNFAESLPGEVVSTVYDWGHGLWDNKDKVIIGTLTGAGAGTLLGTPGGPAGMAAGAVSGGVTGTIWGAKTAWVMDAFKQSTGQVYFELLDTMPDDDASEAERRALALGAGALMGLVEVVPVQVIASKIPVLKKLTSPRALAKELLKPTNKPLMDFVKDIGTVALVGGAEEGVQELISIVAGEMGKTWDGDSTSFLEGARATLRNWSEEKYGQQVFEAVALGTIASPAIAVTGKAISPVAETALGMRRDRSIQLGDPDSAPGTPEGGPMVAEVDALIPSDLPQSNLIYDDQLKQLREVGVDEEKAAHVAKVTENVFTTLGKHTGVDPTELYQKQNIKIQKGDSEAEGTSFEQQPFHLRSVKVIEEKMGNSATVEQVNGLLKDIKAEERKWLGLDEFLEGKKKVSKEELITHLEANRLQIDEVTLSGAADPSHSKATKYGKFTLKGPRENYREILFTLPGGLQYTSPHFKQHPNLLAHARTDDRVGPDGEKILFVEEIQSDWHQEGRRKGYKEEVDEPTKALRERADKYIDEVLVPSRNEVRRLMGETRYLSPSDADYVLHGGPIARLDYATRTAIEANPDLVNAIEDHKAKLAEYNRLHTEAYNFIWRPPDAPFRNTWHEFVLKRLITEAAEKGYDKIAWTTGEQQAERYNLSKHIESVTYNTNSGYLAAYDHNGYEVLGREGVQPNQIADYIGKEAADRLLKSETFKSELGNPVHKIVGTDLKFGGEGMKGFYDKMIPSFLNKFTKKYGTRVSTTTLGNGESVHSLTLTPELKEAALTSQFPLFQREGDTAKGRIIFTPEGINIDLLEKADFSTIVHELAHLYLDVAGKAVRSDTASAEFKSHYDNILSWLGSDGSELTTEQHEQFARGFEAYLMEGKAPTPTLTRAFEAFKKWLTDVYNSIAQLNVELTDDARSGFDFLLGGSEIISPEGVNNVIDLGARALRGKMLLDQLSQGTIGTKTNEFLPEDRKYLVTKMAEEAGISHFFLDEAELRSWANTDEKAQAVESLLSDVEVDEALSDAPIMVPVQSMVRLVDQFPDASLIAKLDAEGPSAQSYLAEAEKLDAQVKSMDSEARVVETLNDIDTQRPDIFQSPTMESVPTFTDPQVPEETEANSRLQRRRSTLYRAIRTEARNNNIQTVEDSNALIEQVEAADRALDEKLDPKKIEIVEDFMNNMREGIELTPAQELLKSQGKPSMAINPESLSAEVRARFENNPTLKARGVFHPQGESAQTVTQLFGLTSPEELLSILSESPTRTEANQIVANEMERVSKIQSRKATEADNTPLANAYDSVTEAHLSDAEAVRRRFNLKEKADKLTAVNARATEIVRSTFIKYLSPTQWKVAERNSQVKASRAVSEGKGLVALKAKNNAAFNSQMAKESHIAISKVNTELTWVANLKNSMVRQEIESQPDAAKALDVFLDGFGFDETKRGQTNLDDFNKFAEKLAKRGDIDLRMDDSIWELADGEVKPQDLTLDQLQYITGKMRGIVHYVRTRNQLYGNALSVQHGHIMDVVVDTLHQDALAHPDYDTGRLAETSISREFLVTAGRFLRRALNFFTNIQFRTLHLDKGVAGGKWSKMIYRPLDDASKMEVAIQGNNKRIIVNQGIREYGFAKWRELGRIQVDVKEFRNLPGLNKGQLRKSDLFTLAMHLGSDSNRDRLSNYGLSADEMQAVILKHLSEKDLDFIQKYVWDHNETFRQRVIDNHFDTTGEILEIVKPRAFEAFGKTYRGGYMPIKYQGSVDNQKLADQVNALFDAADPSKASSGLAPIYDYDGMVRSPHTKDRTGSDWLIDYRIETWSMALDEIAHDLAYRKALLDTMKILKNKTVRDDISSILGKEGYNALANDVVSLSHNLPGMKLYADQDKMLNNIMTNVNGAASIIYVAGNLSSVLMSTLTIPSVIMRMGPNGAKHLANTVFQFMAAPHKWRTMAKTMNEFAAEIDATRSTFREGLDDFSMRALSRDLPKTRTAPIIGRTRAWNFIKRAQDTAVDLSLNTVLGGIDAIAKTITIKAAFDQFMNGDARGHSFESIMALSEAERVKAAKEYAAQISRGSTMAAQELDRAGIQKHWSGQFVARFWNEPRNALNARLQDVRNIKYNGKALKDALLKGDLLEGVRQFDDAAMSAFRIILWASVTRAIFEAARGDLDIRSDEEKEWEDTEDMSLTEYLLTQGLSFPRFVWERGTTVEGLLSTLNDSITGNVPVLKDMIYSAETGRGMTVPLFQMLSSVAGSAGAMIDIYENVKLELTLSEAFDSLSRKQRRDLMTTFGLSMGGLPTNGPMKIYEYFRNLDDQDRLPPMPPVMDQLLEVLDEKLKGDGEDAWMWDEEGDEEWLWADEDDMIANSRALRDTLVPPDKTLNDYQFEVIKFAESGGKWNAQPDRGSAFGLYQFTEETWNRVMNSPEGRAAGLTRQGWTAKPPKSQQEEAMRILTAQNIQIMRNQGVPINLESVYFAHHFGPSRAKEVYGVPDETRLSRGRGGLLSPTVLRNNPWLLRKKVRTAGDMKEYIRFSLARGEKELEQKRAERIRLGLE